MNTAWRGLRRVRSVVLRAELAVTGAQILFWAALIGVVAGLALRAWTRHRQSQAEPEAPVLAD